MFHNESCAHQSFYMKNLISPWTLIAGEDKKTVIVPTIREKHLKSEKSIIVHDPGL